MPVLPHSSPFPVLRDGPVDVLGLRLDTAVEAGASMASLLSEPERQKAGRFRAQQHQLEYICAHAWLRLLVAERAGLAVEDVVFEEGRHGKPHLAAEPSGGRLLSFNLSHSGAVALYAFSSEGRDIGVDVEAYRAIPDLERLAQRFFSPDEARALKYYGRDVIDRAFLACWTRKEAFIKALGLGLHCPLDAFDVTIDPDGPAELLRVDERTGTRAADWRMRSFIPLEGYIAAFAERRTRAN